MIDRDYTAEQAAKALVHAASEGIDCTVVIGQMTYRFNREHQPEAAPVVIDASGPDGMARAAEAMSRALVLENLRRAVAEAFPNATDRLYGMSDADLADGVRQGLGL